MAKIKSISFAGGGFRTISYVGQLVYLEKLGLISKGNTQFYGASLGAILAAAMIIGETSMDARKKLIGRMLEYVCEVHQSWVGMWGICGPVTKRALEAALPDDVSTLNGRLFISVTVLAPWPHSTLVSEFASKEDLIETILASQFIPGWTCGLLPFKMWRGWPCVDGGVFDNIPDPSGRRFGVLSLESVRQTFAKPSLRGDHYICRDPDAPVAQVLRPPRGDVVQHAIFQEIQRGYLDARCAIVGYSRTI